MKIILLNGPPGCGKDTAAEFIRKHSNGLTRDVKLAMPLRKVMRTLFDVDNETFNLMMGELKDSPSLMLGNHSARKWMIAISENLMKPMLGQAALGHFLVQQIKGTPARVVTVSDCGFDYEVTPLQDAFGHKTLCGINIERPGHDFRNDSRMRIDFESIGVQDHATISNEHDLELYEQQVRRVLKMWGLTREYE